MSSRRPPPMAEIPDLGDGRFEIVERIGAGGMGAVYRAIQKSVGRQVAVKVLSPEHAANATGVNRFVREANVVSKLVHPNIVSVIDFGKDARGNLLMVMELLDGEPLRKTLRRHGRLSVPRAVSIALQVLAALRVAHHAGVIHRDLKPENVMMCRVDGQDLVKVLDFGIAKLVAGDGIGQDTTAGSLVGTLRYMAPEQIAGDPPDARVDLYAVGVLLYEMLTGTLPFDAKDKLQLLRAILNDPPVPIVVRAPDVPEALSRVVMRAIHKLPIDRFSSAEEMRDALLPLVQSASGEHSNPLYMLGGLAPSPARPVNDVPSDDTGSTRSERGRAVAALSMAVQPQAPAGVGQPIEPARPFVPSEFTTSAGVSAASQRITDVPRRSNAWTIAAAAVGVITLGTTAGLLLGRAHSDRRDAEAASHAATAPTTSPNPGTPTAPTAPTAPVDPTAGATATAVMVRSDPPGAAVTDAASGETLCTATPCAVPVVVGRSRRIAVALNGQTVQAVLEAGLPALSVDLHGAGASSAGSGGHGGHAHVPMFGGGSHSGGGGAVPMFAPVPTSGGH